MGLLTAWVLVALTLSALATLEAKPLSLEEAVVLSWNKRTSILVFGTIFWAGEELLSAVGRMGPSSLEWTMSVCVGIWSFSLYLAFPVLAREQRSGLGALNRALSLIRIGWASRLLGSISLGVRAFVYIIPAMALATIAGMISKAAIAPTLTGGIALTIGAFFLVADQVFDAALYMSLTDVPAATEMRVATSNEGAAT